jgi:hypothetical protein
LPKLISSRYQINIRSNKKGWFVALLILNTLAILEILYIFIFSQEKEEAIAPEIKK